MPAYKACAEDLRDLPPAALTLRCQARAIRFLING